MKSLDDYIKTTAGILDILGESVLVCDADGVIRFINKAALSMLEITKRKALNHPLENLIGTFTTERLKARDFQSFSGPMMRFKSTQNNAKGRLLASPIRLGVNTDKTVGAVLVLREKVMDYRIAVRDFKSRNNMIRAIDKLKDRVCMVNDVKVGRQVFVSEAFKDLVGWPASIMLNGNWAFVSTLMHPDDLGRVKKDIETTVARYSHADRRFDNEPYTSHYRLRHKNGNWINLVENGCLLQRDVDGKPLYLLSFLEAVNDHRENGMSTLHLSPREMEVAQAVVNGESSKLIAARFGLSVHTVNEVRKNLRVKTGAVNTAALVKFLSQNDIR